MLKKPIRGESRNIKKQSTLVKSNRPPKRVFIERIYIFRTSRNTEVSKRQQQPAPLTKAKLDRFPAIT